MTWVSLALLAFGVADLVRARGGRMPLSLAPLAGVVTLVVLSIITDVHALLTSPRSSSPLWRSPAGW